MERYILAPGTLLYRLRAWNEATTPSFTPLWFVTDPQDLVYIGLYRDQTRPANVTTDWTELPADIYEVRQPITVISLTTEWNYLTLETVIQIFDPSYLPGITAQPAGEPPEGDNHVAAHWLEDHSLTGWYEDATCNGFMTEVMLTTSGMRRTTLRNTVPVREVLDDL